MNPSNISDSNISPFALKRCASDSLSESGGKRYSLGIHAGKNQMTALVATASK